MLDMLKEQSDTLKEIRLRSEESEKKEAAKQEQSTAKSVFKVFWSQIDYHHLPGGVDINQTLLPRVFIALRYSASILSSVDGWSRVRDD